MENEKPLSCPLCGVASQESNEGMRRAVRALPLDSDRHVFNMKSLVLGIVEVVLQDVQEGNINQVSGLGVLLESARLIFATMHSGDKRRFDTVAPAEMRQAVELLEMWAAGEQKSYVH